MPTQTNLSAALKAFNDKLPPGITASFNRGVLRYKVMMTTTSAMGRVTRHGLGTFINYGDAVKAVVEFKVRGYIEGMPNLKEEVAKLVSAELADVNESAQEMEDAEITATLLLSKEAAAMGMIQSASKAVQPGGIEGAFSILNNMPFHEVPTSGDCVTSLEDGTPVTIPAKIVAEWFSSLQA